MLITVFPFAIESVFSYVHLSMVPCTYKRTSDLHPGRGLRSFLPLSIPVNSCNVVDATGSTGPDRRMSCGANLRGALAAILRVVLPINAVLLIDDAQVRNSGCVCVCGPWALLCVCVWGGVLSERLR